MANFQVTSVKAHCRFVIDVAFADGTRGTVDLAGLAGKGVFRAWNKTGAFEKCFVDPVSGTVAWPGGIDLCPETLHRDISARVKGRSANSQTNPRRARSRKPARPRARSLSR